MVIREEFNRALILKKEFVGAKPYHKDFNGFFPVWQNCGLRQWMKDFYVHSFTEEQKALILEINIAEEDKSKRGRDDVNNAKDKIFLLGTSEAEEYLTNDIARKAKYAWWLRSTSHLVATQAVYIDEVGQIIPYGKHMAENLGVRPALWLNLV
jgi:hypothetical protein